MHIMLANFLANLIEMVVPTFHKCLSLRIRKTFIRTSDGFLREIVVMSEILLEV